MRKIPVSEPLLQGNEKKYLQQCVDTNWVSSEGYFVKRFEEEFAKWAGTKYAITVSSGTSALETALWSIGCKEGTTVYMSVMTIISCAIAVKRLNAYFHFLDINEKFQVDTSLISEIDIAMLIHLFGFKGYNNSKLLPLRVIDDFSQYWKPKPKVHQVGIYSLYANKLITTGEGGMIVTNDSNIAEKARNYRNLCHSDERFIHTDLGYNFRMSNLQAAVGLAQLEQIDKFIEIKQKNQRLYKKYLPNNIKLFEVEVPWMHLIKTPYKAQEIQFFLKWHGIDSRRLYCPLHKQPDFYSKQSFPVAEDMYKHCLYLPSGLTLTEEEIEYVCQSLRGMRSITI